MRYKNQGLVVSWYDALREVRAAATAGVVQDPIKNGAVPRRTVQLYERNFQGRRVCRMLLVLASKVPAARTPHALYTLG